MPPSSSAPRSLLVIFDAVEPQNAIKPRFIEGTEILNWQDGPDRDTYIRNMADQGWVVPGSQSGQAIIFKRAEGQGDLPVDIVRLLITDDQKPVREGYRVILSSEKDIQVIGEASDGQEAIDLVQELQPDVITMDLKMPGIDGLDATKRIRQMHPDSKIIIVAMSWDAALVKQAVLGGASGYVAKTDLLELGPAVRSVREDKPYFSTTILNLLSSQNMPLP